MRTQSRIMKCWQVGLGLFLLLASVQSLRAQEIPATGQGAEPVVESESAAELEGNTPHGLSQPELSRILFLPAIAGAAADGSDEAEMDETEEVSTAFSHTWTPDGCTNVGSDGRGLWDDLPGMPDETALFWIRTNDAANEVCRYRAPLYGISSTTFNRLVAHVALNDGAILNIKVYRYSGSDCKDVVRTLSFTTADSVFRGAETTLPPGFSLCKVQIELTDWPDNVGSYRATALLNYITFYGPGGDGWVENFMRSR